MIDVTLFIKIDGINVIFDGYWENGGISINQPSDDSDLQQKYFLEEYRDEIEEIFEKMEDNYYKLNSYNIIEIEDGRVFDVDISCDGIQEIEVWSTEEVELEEGMKIYTTSSEFDYDMLKGVFQENTEHIGTVICELIEEDYSEFEPDRCCTGGAYSFHEWEIIEVE